MNTKTYIEKAKDREMLKHILEYIGDNTKLEDVLAKTIEDGTDGAITKDEFHDWMGTFDLNDYTE